MKLQYFLIQTDDPDVSLSWIGGPLLAAPLPGHIYLTKPNGEPVFQARLDRVRSITLDEMQALFRAEVQSRRATLN